MTLPKFCARYVWAGAPRARKDTAGQDWVPFPPPILYNVCAMNSRLAKELDIWWGALVGVGAGEPVVVREPLGLSTLESVLA